MSSPNFVASANASSKANTCGKLSGSASVTDPGQRLTGDVINLDIIYQLSAVVPQAGAAEPGNIPNVAVYCIELRSTSYKRQRKPFAAVDVIPNCGSPDSQACRMPTCTSSVSGVFNPTMALNTV